MWVPGLVGLAVYSAEDCAAKDALVLPVSSLTVPHSDYKNDFIKETGFYCKI